MHQLAEYQMRVEADVCQADGAIIIICIFVLLCSKGQLKIGVIVVGEGKNDSIDKKYDVRLTHMASYYSVNTRV